MTNTTLPTVRSVIKSNVKAGGWANHNQPRIKSGGKAGGLHLNHNQPRIKSGVKAGGWSNHNQARIKSSVKAGGIIVPERR
jgi:hypothetical protein